MCFTKKHNLLEFLITGVAVTSTIGQGRIAFASALQEGRHAFGVMQRPARQKGTSFSGCRLTHAYINATKSITGHGLSAAGTVEVIATLMQMKASRIHPTRNLEDPIESSCNWVRGRSVPHVIEHALSLNMGFGGINTAICFKNIKFLFRAS